MKKKIGTVKTRKSRSFQKRKTTKRRKIQKGGYSVQDLFHAVNTNNYKEVKKIIRENTNFLDAQDAQGNTALHIASSKNFLNIVKFLFTYYSPSFPLEPHMENFGGLQPLDLAARNNSIDVLHFLLEEELTELTRYTFENASAGRFSPEVNKIIMDAYRAGRNIAPEFNNENNYKHNNNNNMNMNNNNYTASFKRPRQNYLKRLM